MQNLNVLIEPAQTRRFEIQGRYLEILAAPLPVTITFYGQDGSISAIARDIESGTYANVQFSAFEIRCASSPMVFDRLVQLFIADIEAGTKRQTGEVEVVDGERQKVFDGRCFMQAVASIGTGAGTPSAQLFNQSSGSTAKNLIIQNLHVSTSTATGWTLALNTVALTNIAAGNPINNYGALTAPAPQAVMRVQATIPTAVLGAPKYGQLAANERREIVFRRPIVLSPGYGLCVYCQDTSAIMRAEFEWEEWPR